VDANLLDEAAKPVPPAEPDDQSRSARFFRLATSRRISPGEEALEFGLRQPVMAAGGVRGPDLALIDPLFQRRIPDAELFGSGPHRQKRHGGKRPPNSTGIISR